MSGSKMPSHEEKAMNAWQRRWKTRLIEEQNPGWNDLYDQLNE